MKSPSLHTKLAVLVVIAASSLSIVEANCLSTLPESGCYQVSTWSGLKNAIENSRQSICFSGFDILKESYDEAIEIIQGRNRTISCQRDHVCRIQGPGRHLSINGLRSKISIFGFTFEGANTAVSVGSKRGLQSFCGCNFIRNKSDGFGGAIKVSSKSSVEIESCSFVDNGAVSGSGIYFKGKKLKVSNSIFKENTGSALHCASGTNMKRDQTCEFRGNNFVKNGVPVEYSQGNGPKRRGESRVLDLGGNTASEQSGCNGVLDYDTGRCLLFSHVVEGILTQQGVNVRLIAKAGEPVKFTSKDAAESVSHINFHTLPDGAATFPLSDGGWAYVSNSEAPDKSGGVFAIYFDQFGEARDYKSLLSGTTRNCGGGKSIHSTWISCEETAGGQCWQVDPTGEMTSQRTLLGGPTGGRFESVAADDRDPLRPVYFVTEDSVDGALRKYTTPIGSSVGWDSLHTDGGIVEYLNLLPQNKFEWTFSIDLGRKSALDNYPHTEGIAFMNGMLLFVAKKSKKIFILDLDTNTYEVNYTINTASFITEGDFSAQPDQIVFGGTNVLCFTEDGGNTAGVYCRNNDGLYVTVFESANTYFRGDETTGLAFSPNKKILYACMQDCGCDVEQTPKSCGCCLEFRREDGLAFNANTLDLRHHNGT